MTGSRPGREGDTGTDDAGEIRELEERRYRAMRDGDVRILDTLLADDMLYLHSNAITDSKSSLLAKIRNEELRCQGMRHQLDEPVIVVGGTAVVCGQVTGTVHVNGVAVALRNRGLAVWSRQPAGWQLVSYQSTPIPARN